MEADATQMHALAHAWAESVPNTAFLAPHAPFPHRSGIARFLPFQVPGHGRTWYRTVGRSLAAQESGVRFAADYLNSFIDAELRAWSLPANAYALAGHSQGAILALFAGLRRPVAPRAIIAFSGALIGSDALTTEIRNHAPVLLIHGEADNIIPASNSRAAEQALRAIGVPVEAIYRPSLGHEIDAFGISVSAGFLHNAFT